jgi:hypothetical protein
VALATVPSTPRLVVVAHSDLDTAASLRHAVGSTAGWQALVAGPGDAGLAAALAAKPAVALVECALLADLPADCRTPLVAVGDDRPADVRAAMLAGARSLLAWPDGAADLPGELARVAATAPDPGGGHSALVIATRGVHRAAPAPPRSPPTSPPPGPAGAPAPSSLSTSPAAWRSASTWGRFPPGAACSRQAT